MLKDFWISNELKKNWKWNQPLINVTVESFSLKKIFGQHQWKDSNRRYTMMVIWNLEGEKERKYIKSPRAAAKISLAPKYSRQNKANYSRLKTF